MDPISKAYMSIINESVPSSEVKTDLKVGAAFGDKDNEKNVTSFIKGSGPDEVEGVDKADEAPEELTSDVDSSLKKLSGVKEAKNPFDVLFNKIVSEETFNFSTEKDNEIDPSNAFDDSSLDNYDENEEDSDVDEFMDSEDEGSEEVTLTLDKEIANKLIEILQAAVGGEEEGEEEAYEEGEEEGEEEAYEEEEGEEEGETEEKEKTFPESFALDDAEKLNVDKAVKELTNPKNHVVNSALKAKSKKAETPAVGKKSDGKLSSHSTKSGVSKLTSKKQEVTDNSAKKGKLMFDLK
jgi:hypothetical protein